MNKKVKIYIVLFIAIVGLLMYADATKVKPISWFPSYVAKHKMPYGTYVLRKELPIFFPNSTIKDINTAPYVFLQDSTVSGTYFFLDGAINFGEDEFNELLKFVERGNDVFLSTSGSQIDTLGLKTSSLSTLELNEKHYVSLLNPAFSDKKYSFDKPMPRIYFEEIDTMNTTTLGKITMFDKDSIALKSGVNFIKHKFGKGNFYINTFPLAFTNYNILHQKNDAYVASVLSYLDSEKPILWDAYYKTGKDKITSPLNYILNSKSLKWAYYIALIGVLFFVFFKGKREQRNIPIITPLKNQTLAFTRTISNMYYEKSQHQKIANQKINYFLVWVRSKMNIPTDVLNQSFYKHLASRSNNTEEDTEKVFKKIAQIQQLNTVSKEQLIALNSLIETYKSKTQ
ncbi:DUF4350 domain-containing protein [Tenacibaculum aquimarinum]|uniref:DUF4350 domain-containing protein n=1 Tax=Tenacibaculum aquimarinum TaxID=2910675 RepID=UPI001F0A2F02|nr:DUF4350 domain-containing protein [Tenacibaculum aquimarinum]MCH3884940.1 DUF4350 domain-containing protein [Tenacibaculum aquimarinum]